MKKRLFTLLVLLTLSVFGIISYAGPVSAATPLVRYHVTFDESINEGRFKTLQLEHKPLLEMLKRMDFTFTANQEFTYTDSIELPLTKMGTSTRGGGSGTMTIIGRANLIEGETYTYSFEGTLTYSSETQWIDDRGANVPYGQGTDGTIEFQSTGPFRIALTNNTTPEKSMVNYGGSSLELAAKSVRIAKANIQGGTVSEAIRDPDTLFTSLAFNVYTSRQVDTLPSEEKKNDSFTFTGNIVDYAERPMKYMEVWITSEGETHKGSTDAAGNYSIMAAELEELPASYTITTMLRYKKDDKEYFVLTVPDGNSNYFVNMRKEVAVSSESDLHCVYVLSKTHPNEGFRSLIRNELIDNVEQPFTHYMSQAVEFYESLSLYKDFNIPAVSVRCYNNAKGGTCYSYNSGIYLASADMENSSPEAPHNREWHEYNHHVMYSIYGKMPEGVVGGYNVNHAGFLNDSTADSYLEGFAEFMALVTGDFYDLGNGSIYAPIADMDLYYKPWDWRGSAEELSVAAILWKLYDGVYANEIGSTLENLWPVLQTYSKDFAEVYEKLVTAFPDKVGTINALFINHGFFQSSLTGNGAYDTLEPFFDQNQSLRYDANEVFIDLPINDKGKIEVRPDPESKAGYAADASRLDRRSPLSPEGHYIKTNNEVPYYSVNYTFVDQAELNYSIVTRNIDGHITVVVPPSEYVTEVAVEPLGVAHDNSLTFSSDDFYAVYDQSVANGSFLEHDFKISVPVQPLVSLGSSVLSENLPYPLETIEGVIIAEPEQATNELGSEEAQPVEADNDALKSDFNMLLIVIPILLVIFIIGVVVTVVKKRK